MNSSFPVPRLVAWEMTRRCNLKCRHCRASADDAASCSGELTFDEAKALIDDIASFACPVLILTGGEPLLRPDLADIAAYAKSRGLTPAVGTNATLIDDIVASRLAASGVRRISVSLDFPSAGAHDAFRGVPGAFDASIGGIAAARRAGLEIQINTTVTHRNAALLDDLHALAVRLGAVAFHPFFLVPTGRGADLADEALTPGGCEEALARIAALAASSPIEVKPTDAPHYRRVFAQNGVPSGCRTGKGCLAGTGFCFVGATGDVRPCGYFDLDLGNVRTTPFSRIWRESPVFADLRDPSRLKGKCGLCTFRNACGGCRARALAVSGDYLAEEPSCAYVPDAVLLGKIQSAFPVAERPYAVLADGLGMTEEACYARIVALREKGIVRRIGASFDSARMGFVSTLAAFDVDPAALDAVAASVSASTAVTHNYIREGAFNLWFTVTAESRARVSEIVRELSVQPGVRRALDLPAKTMFKLRAVFPSGSADDAPAPRRPPAPAAPVPLSREDRALVARIQNDIVSLGPAPFSADETRRLSALLASGTVRRFGAFLDPRGAGFAVNALTAWDVPDEVAETVGRSFAALDGVTHCLLRPRAGGWPYTLYAMTHARSDADLDALIAGLSDKAAALAGTAVPKAVMKTVKECKKSPMRYERPALFPVFLSLEGRACLVVGGGKVALRKARALVEAGACVTVVAPEIDAGFAVLPGCRLARRAFRPSDVEGCALAVSAASDRDVNALVSTLCSARAIPVNVVDDPPRCTFHFPAVAKAGALTVAVSSGGQSPVAARFARDLAARALPEDFIAAADRLAEARDELKKRFPDAGNRKDFCEKELAKWNVSAD